MLRPRGRRPGSEACWCSAALLGWSRCAAQHGPNGLLFCREAFGGSLAALPRSNLRDSVQVASPPSPPTTSARGRKLPYFAPNFSPPPPFGLHYALRPLGERTAFTAKNVGEERNEPMSTSTKNRRLIGQLLDERVDLSIVNAARDLGGQRKRVRQVRSSGRARDFRRWCRDF